MIVETTMTQFPETSSSLLLQVQSVENVEAWETFVRTYQPVIYRMARRRGMQDADARDVVQDVLIRVSNALPLYESKPGIRFRNWLGKVAKNTILTALTRSSQDVGKGGRDARDILAERPNAGKLPTEELDLELMRETYHRAAAMVRTEVNAETWTAFEKTVIYGMTCEDAATSLGKSVGTIYAARSRVFRRLRTQVQTIMGDG